MLLLVGYLMVTRTAERRNAARVLSFAFWRGLIWRCSASRFCRLPWVRRGSGVRQAVRRQAAGQGFWQRNIFHGMCFCGARCSFLTAAVCFSWEIPVFPLAFLGGVGLYHASAGILPEPVSIRNALFSAGGFLVGVFLFSPLL